MRVHHFPTHAEGADTAAIERRADDWHSPLSGPLLTEAALGGTGPGSGDLKIPRKLRADLTWILDSVCLLTDAKMTSGPRSHLEKHNRFVDEVME
jgi:hypothetical protein